MITVYLLETFAVLLAAATIFFLLGTSFGWVLWGRFKKMLVEWKSNAERLNRRIAGLEEELDRGEIIRHELETEKKEVLEIFAKRKREMAAFEEDASAVETDLRETREKLEAAETLAAETETARAEWEEKANTFEAKIAERTAVIEALNDRIDTIQRERDAEIGILKAKLLATEQERETEQVNVRDIAKRVAAGAESAGLRNRVTARAKKDSSKGDAVTTPRRKGGRKSRKEKAQMDLELG